MFVVVVYRNVYVIGFDVVFEEDVSVEEKVC
jgi:hypothetical protein